MIYPLGSESVRHFGTLRRMIQSWFVIIVAVAMGSSAVVAGYCEAAVQPAYETVRDIRTIITLERMHSIATTFDSSPEMIKMVRDRLTQNVQRVGTQFSTSTGESYGSDDWQTDQ